MKLSILQKLQVYLNPHNWIRNYQTSSTLSKSINTLLDNGEKILIISPFEVKLGPHYLWIENYPYAYGSDRYEDIMPDRQTVYRLHKEVESRGIKV